MTERERAEQWLAEQFRAMHKMKPHPYKADHMARIAAEFAERLALAERARNDGCHGISLIGDPLPWAEAIPKEIAESES